MSFQDMGSISVAGGWYANRFLEKLLEYHVMVGEREALEHAINNSNLREYVKEFEKERKFLDKRLDISAHSVAQCAAQLVLGNVKIDAYAIQCARRVEKKAAAAKPAKPGTRRKVQRD